MPREVPPSTPTQIPIPTDAAEPQGLRAGRRWEGGEKGDYLLGFGGLPLLILLILKPTLSDLKVTTPAL